MQNNVGDSDVTGVLLAGGRSLRMGGMEKALLAIAGEPMLAHVIARLRPQVRTLVINTNSDPAHFSSFGLPVVRDIRQGFTGPLAGLDAGMMWVQSNTPNARFLLSVPGDTPFLPRDLVERLKSALQATQATCAIAASGGTRHPIVGLWDVMLVSAVADALESGIRAMHRFAEDNTSVVVDFPDVRAGGVAIDPFFNVNTPADLETARALFSNPTNRETARD